MKHKSKKDISHQQKKLVDIKPTKKIEPVIEEIKAEELATKQKEISVSEFFAKNRHLLGFDNPARALLMTVKECVDNSLDACTEMKALPEVIVQIKQAGENKYVVSVEDNGPGIVKEQIPRVFGKLLYGSKFHRRVQSRGQQGIGVCMTGDTLVPLGDGRVLPVREIVDAGDDVDLFVLTPDLKLGLGKVDKFWKIPAPAYFVRIETLGGKEIVLTPENPILTRTEAGLEWKDAETLSVGDYVAVSRKLSTHISDEKIAIFDFLDDETQIDNYSFACNVLHRLREKYSTWDGVAKRFGLNKHRVKGWRKKQPRRRPTKQLLEIFCSDLNIPRSELIKQSRRVGKLGTYVTIPLYVNEKFMSFLGYISGDGASQPKRADRWGRSVSLWNDDSLVRNHFREIIRHLFGIRGAHIKHSKGRGEMIQFSSSLIARIINIFGIPSGKKFDSFTISPLLHRKDLLRPYLQALFDCEGSVSVDRKVISFMIRNKSMTRYLSLFLQQFGITARINRANDDTRLIISSKTNIRRFSAEIGFIHSQKKDDLALMSNHPSLDEKKSHLDTIPFLHRQLNALKNSMHLTSNDFSYPHIFSRKGAISYPVLQSAYEVFLSKMGAQKIPIELQEIHCLLQSDIVWVKVTHKEREPPSEPFVYDLTMRQGNNFIANGILVHNSASVLYAQLTTGKSTRITSKIHPKKPAHYYELQIDTRRNEPKILVDREIEWNKEHGTKVELELEGKYQKGKQSVDEFIKQCAIVNPHARFLLLTPDNEKTEFPRAVNQLPIEAKEIKPHPYGTEVGTLIRMLEETTSRTLQGFLTSDFCRIGSGTAKEICEKALLQADYKPQSVTHQEADRLFKVMQETKIIAPPLDCLSPIGEAELEKGLKKEIQADFYVAISRPPTVYRGFPFSIETAIAFGGSLDKEGQVRLMRFANRVPLLYQQGACAITEAAQETNWRPYGLQQSGDNLPVGPAAIAVHMASVWVPFTSEAKDALAHYPDIMKEIKLALQEAGRKLGIYIRKNVRAKEAKERVNLFENYIPEVASSLSKLTSEKKEVIVVSLQKILKKGVADLLAQANGESNGRTEKQE